MRCWVFACLAACGGQSPQAQPDASQVPDPARGPVTLASTRQLCKLLSDRNMRDPTQNDVQHRANVAGADLGIPVVHDDRFYLMFGDTIGHAGIWPPGESHPDAVGVARDPASAIAAQPALVCTRLEIVTLSPAQSIGPVVDATVAADFAGVAMTAPSGQGLGEYIKNPAGGGAQTFPHLPGDFEVPSGAFAHGDSIYVFYTTVAGPGKIAMKGSYLARWRAPSPSKLPAYQILYGVDQRFDESGPLGGNFINVAAEVHGDYVYMFGTGEFRQSGIHLARKRLDMLDQPGGFELLGEIVGTRGYGETSVRYFAAIDRWMLLAEELGPTSNRIVAYVAERPEGPWSAPIVVHDMADAGFRAAYCCEAEDQCRGEEFFNCNRTGFYATYLFPDVIATAGGFTVTYTMSSFSPYNVALYQATFATR